MKKFIQEIDIYKPFIKLNVKLDGVVLSSQIASEKQMLDKNFGLHFLIQTFSLLLITK